MSAPAAPSVPRRRRSNAFRLAGFVEKPREARAKALINEGAFWNSGMFLYGRDTLLDEIARDGYRVLERRIALTPLRKLWIAWKTWVST